MKRKCYYCEGDVEDTKEDNDICDSCCGKLLLGLIKPKEDSQV